MNAPRIGIIVLAAGASARMGAPKQLLHYEGETLLRRAVRAARDSLCRPVIVVLGAQAEALKIEVGAGVEVVVNQDWAEGLAASIRCGLRALETSTASRAEACVLMLCDQPFITSAIINRLITAYETSGRLLVASEYAVNEETTQGVPALFRRALFAELLSLRGAEGAKRIIKRHKAEAAFVAVPEAAFDVDTPADYRRLMCKRDAAGRPNSTDGV